MRYYEYMIPKDTDLKNGWVLLNVPPLDLGLDAERSELVETRSGRRKIGSRRRMTVMIATWVSAIWVSMPYLLRINGWSMFYDSVKN